MKTISFLSVILFSAVALADVSIPRVPKGGRPRTGYGVPRTPSGPTNIPGVGIPRGEKEQLLALELVRLTGLNQEDSLYSKALTQCASNNAEASQYFQELVEYFKSSEFKAQSGAKKKQEITMARIEIKISCAQELGRFGIDP